MYTPYTQTLWYRDVITVQVGDSGTPGNLAVLTVYRRLQLSQ
jgi:hypothetical protein